MSTVYVVHEPSRWVARRGCMERLDLSPAARWGDLRVVFPGPDLPPTGDEAAQGLRQAFAEYKTSDYLVLAGDTDLVVWAALLAARAANGNISLLKWDGRLRDYVVRSAPAGLLSEGETV